MSNSQGKHFSQPDGGGSAASSRSDAPRGTAGDQRSAGFIPVVTSDPSAKGAGSSRHNRRMKSDSYRETDPYDLSGRRSRDPRKRRNRIISTVLFIVGITLIVAAAGMYLSLIHI